MPTDNNGGCDRIRTELVGTRNTIVIRFDVSQLPVDPVIATTLELQITSQTDADFDAAGALRVFRLTESWVEGTACGTAGAANWTERASGVQWSSAGASAPPTIDPQLLARLQGPALHEQRIAFELPAALIDSWIASPAENHGIALLGENEDSAMIYSRETVQDGKRPRLRVTQQD